MDDTYGTHLYAADYRWWKYHIADITRDFNGTCWTQDVQWAEAGKPVDPAQWGIKKLISLDKPGLSTKPGIIHRGGNSTYQATGLGYHLGGTRFIYIGLDLMMNGQRHWFGEHPKGVGLVSNYHNFITYFRTIKPAEYGIEILNCSRETALEAFPRHHLEDVF